MNKQEEHLKQIISSCESILDDIDSGATIEQADFNMLGYCEGIMSRMQENINKQLSPTNIKDD